MPSEVNKLELYVKLSSIPARSTTSSTYMKSLIALPVPQTLTNLDFKILASCVLIIFDNRVSK